jgi:transcriptional regulator with XRE-family HTH domain
VSNDYARALGARLRQIRTQQELSLHDVEKQSNGRWKAVVVGSYERGDRAISVHKLADLAEFYGAPVAQLLPDGGDAGTAPPAPKVVVDLSRLGVLNDPASDPLSRYLAAIQSMRGDYNGKVLSMRQDDLRALAIVYDETPLELVDRLIEWQLVDPAVRGSFAESAGSDPMSRPNQGASGGAAAAG